MAAEGSETGPPSDPIAESADAVGRSRAPRLFAPALSDLGDFSDAFESEPIVVLPPEEDRHARKVLRAGPEDPVELFDGQGRVAQARLANRGEARVASLRRVPRVTPQLTVAVALPRGSRAADLVDQLSQLGVDALIPLITEHSASNGSSFRRDRLERAAITAGKQSGRDWLMTIADPIAFAEVIKPSQAQMQIRAMDPRGQPLTNPLEVGCDVCLMIGPEGGWSAGEEAAMDRAAAQGVDLKRWRLPTPVLRVETAAVAATAIAVAQPGWRSSDLR